MRRIYLKRISTLLLIFTLGAASLNAAGRMGKHTIKSGDTLYDIAHYNHTTIEKLRKINHLKKGETLKIGKVLKVPSTSKSKKKSLKLAKKAKKTSTENYKINSGDSLYTIAHSRHTTILKLRELNHLKKGEVLKIGKVLKVPGTSKSKKKSLKLAKKAKKTSTENYKISSGDSLYSIAHSRHTTILKLRELNHLEKGEVLKIGKVLKVPSTSKSKKRSVKLAQKSQKHSVKTHKASKKHTEKRLAKALKGIKSKKISHVKRSNKFALSDIIFSKKNHASTKGKKLIALAKKKLGKRYVWGATGQKNTFDCSGLTTYVCKKNGIKIPRRAIAQSKYGKYVSRKNLKPGDLIFFDTSKKHRGYVNHVGIYIGNNKFIHASSAKKKVIITSLSKPFYSQRYKIARRVGS